MVFNSKIQTKQYTLAEIKKLAEEALTYLDTKLATEVQTSIENLFKQENAKSSVFDELNVMLAKMKFIRFASLSISDLDELIKTELLECYTIPNFDLRDKIGKRIIFLGDVESQIDFMSRLSDDIEHCAGRLGAKNIVIDTKTLEPTIANWIKVYLNQPAKSALRTNIEEWAFVEQNSATKVLSEAEKYILLDIIKIYDSLRNRVHSFRSLPESDDEKEIFPNFDLYVSLPGLTINEQDSSWKQKYGNILDPKIEGGEDEISVSQIPPASKPDVINNVNLNHEKISKIIKPVQILPQQSSFQSRISDQPTPKPVNIQDILHERQSKNTENDTPGFQFGIQNRPEEDRNLETRSEKQGAKPKPVVPIKPIASPFVKTSEDRPASLTPKPSVVEFSSPSPSPSPSFYDKASADRQGRGRPDIDKKLEELRKKTQGNKKN